MGLLLVYERGDTVLGFVKLTSGRKLYKKKASRMTEGSHSVPQECSH